jgi:hypothetical protein
MGKVVSPSLQHTQFKDQKVQQDYTSTFADNMSLPVHKWFRYTAGFSACWVEDLLKEQRKLGKKRVIDPFAGSGTVLIEAEKAKIESIGIESHPYITRIAKCKLNWNFSPEVFKKKALHFLELARQVEINSKIYPKLITDCFPIETLKRLEALKQTWFLLEEDPIIKDFIWFIITSILRTSSPVGTAQWQYVLPNKSKARSLEPFYAYENKVEELFNDMTYLQKKFGNEIVKSSLFQEDARGMKSIPDGWGDLVITSPPYANNYDYADATRLEMTFWGDIKGWGDLQDNVRKHLVRACTQHVAGLQNEVEELINSTNLLPIKDDLWNTYKALSEVRLTKGGKKNYHFMVAAYFNDLGKVLSNLRRATNDGVLMCWVVGDSAPYGVHIPVERWIGEIAINVGFHSYSFEKLRDRNVKWKNRKHRVPLHEGRLWING